MENLSFTPRARKFLVQNGSLVSDLAPQEFTLVDNDQPAKIRTRHQSLEASEPAPELILVLDAIRLSSPQLTQTESAIVQFLRRNGGLPDGQIRTQARTSRIL